MCKKLLLCVLLPLSLQAGILPALFGRTVYTVEPGSLYRAGAIPPQQLARKIRSLGIKTMVFIDDHYKASSEKKERTEHGVTIHHIPWPTNALPSKQAITFLLNLFATAPHPLLLYSAKAVGVTDGAAALWQRVHRNYTTHFARKQLRHGHHPAHAAFLSLLPTTDVAAWLNTYAPAMHPEHTSISSPRMWPGTNFHAVEEGKLYRSAQLNPRELSDVVKQRGIRTIINLMGSAPGANWYEHEHATAAHHNIAIHDLTWYIDHLPDPAELRRLLQLYEQAEKPLLIHCREGADRTGECAAIWKLHMQQASIHEALKQLTLAQRHFALFHPAKRFFIRSWQGSQWAKAVYHPRLLHRFIHPSHRLPAAVAA